MIIIKYVISTIAFSSIISLYFKFKALQNKYNYFVSFANIKIIKGL